MFQLLATANITAFCGRISDLFKLLSDTALNLSDLFQIVSAFSTIHILVGHQKYKTTIVLAKLVSQINRAHLSLY